MRHPESGMSALPRSKKSCSSAIDPEAVILSGSTHGSDILLGCKDNPCSNRWHKAEPVSRGKSAFLTQKGGNRSTMRDDYPASFGQAGQSGSHSCRQFTGGLATARPERAWGFNHPVHRIAASAVDRVPALAFPCPEIALAPCRVGTDRAPRRVCDGDGQAPGADQIAVEDPVWAQSSQFLREQTNRRCACAAEAHIGDPVAAPAPTPGDFGVAHECDVIRHG